MLILTTPLPAGLGRDVTEVLGPVIGEAVVGMHIGKDITAGIRDIFGGRSASYEKELKGAYEDVLAEIEKRAEALGADAVIGLDFSLTTLGTGSMLAVAACGTAVKLS
ncbi:YbjQ family protein [Peptococcus simiae]|uniref:UPF0145 protein ACKQTC_00310 n=1 Tax=Peptococcus simiae TaxID=1643805 RepID=A0ABW9GVR6_9FIRM